jgi:hypothetical protein
MSFRNFNRSLPGTQTYYIHQNIQKHWRSHNLINIQQLINVIANIFLINRPELTLQTGLLRLKNSLPKRKFLLAAQTLDYMLTHNRKDLNVETDAKTGGHSNHTDIKSSFAVQCLLCQTPECGAKEQY